MESDVVEEKRVSEVNDMDSPNRDNSVLTSDESSASAAGDTPSHSGGGGGSISSSDTESWTIIDDEGVDDSNVALFTEGSVAKFAKSSTTGSKSAVQEDEEENAPSIRDPSTSDSDIEPACDTTPSSDSEVSPLGEVESEELVLPPVTNLGSALLATLTESEQNAESITSDGIPVVPEDDLDHDDEDSADSQGQAWIWANEEDLTPTREEGPPDFPDSKASSKDPSISKKDVSDVLSSLYPMVNELPKEFPSIRRGQGTVYSHVPNNKLNVLLTTCVVLACAMGLGIGIGHFIGWSEKLELQEMYAEERETKMEELTDSLVTCITGEEGNGGDDPDLEEKVIRQLSQENNELKSALAQLKSCPGSGDQQPTSDADFSSSTSDSGSGSHVPVMLRQRINELMLANADLEKEVARLRYAHSAMVEAESTRDDLRTSRSDLIKAKEILNDRETENQQLKIVIGKTRYGGGPSSERSQDDLDSEASVDDDEDSTSDTLREDQDNIFGDDQPNIRSGSEGVERGGDKCPRTAYDYIKKEWRKLRDSTGSLDKIWSRFPKVGREQVRNWGEKFDARMDSVLKSIPAKVAPAGKSFVKGANKIVNKLESSFNKGLAKASQFLETQLGEDPVEWKDKQLNKLEKGLSELLDEWYFDQTYEGADKKKEKEEEKSTCKAKENRHPTEHNGECQAKPHQRRDEGASSDKTHKKYETKENNKKYEHSNYEKDQGKRPEYEKHGKHKHSPDSRWEKRDPSEERSKHWSKSEKRSWNHESNSTTDDEDSKKWMFERAKNREEYRESERKSDWVFERASDRKKYHRFTDAEWYQKKTLNKDCDGDNCEDLTEKNPGSRNHGKKQKKYEKNAEKHNYYQDHKSKDHHKNKKFDEGRENGDKSKRHSSDKKDQVKFNLRKHQESHETQEKRHFSTSSKHKDSPKNVKKSEGDFKKKYDKQRYDKPDHKRKKDFKYEEKDQSRQKHQRDPRQQNPKKFNSRNDYNNNKERKIRYN